MGTEPILLYTLNTGQNGRDTAGEQSVSCTQKMSEDYDDTEPDYDVEEQDPEL
jgi:hypothetical protein